MKKMVALLLVFVMCLSLCACGGSAGSQTPGSPASTPEPTPAPTEAPEGVSAQSIQIGETVSLDYAVLTLDSFEITDGYLFEYHSGNFTRRTRIECSSGTKLVCLRGKFTNKTNSTVFPGNKPVYGRIVINGYEYEAEMNCYVVAEAETILELTPLYEVDCFIYAEVPETLVGQIETCQLYLGFVKDLDPRVWVDNLDEYDALYVVEAIPAVQ